MNPSTRMQFVKRYLSLTNSTFHAESSDELSVTFSEEADRVLARRPFYWAFIDRTGTPAQPMSAVLRAAEMAYPSPFLTDMINDINERGKFVQCFEVVPPGGIPQFETWLNCVITIRCEGSSAMRMCEVVGLSLFSGSVQPNFLDWLGDRAVQAHHPITFHSPTIVTMEQARGILQTFIGEQLSALNLTWAIDAYSNYEKECAIASGHEVRLLECEAQLRPKIEVDVRAAGLFHLLRQDCHQ